MAFALPTFILAFTAIAFAFLHGGKPERAGALILSAMLVLNYTGHAIFPRIFYAVDPVGLTVDLVGLIGFSALGITTRRLWPLWAASLQLLSAGAHFVRALSIPIEARVYFWMKTSPTWIVMVVLILGTVAHKRREKLRSSANFSRS